MKNFVSVAIVFAIILGFFCFGGSVGIGEDGTPYINFDGIWKNAGNALGDAAGDLLDGFVGSVSDSDTIKDLLPDTNKNPTLIAPDIPEDSSFQIHYIDVGQADATLIICDDNAMLIDGGNNDDGPAVVAYLTSLGITELDLVVGTHAHEDHIGGLDDVIEAFPTEQVWYPDYIHGTYTETSFLDAAKERNITPYQPEPGTTYTLGSAICQVVGPINLDTDEPNNTSIVIRVLYGDTAFLFCGDAEFDEESAILEAGYDISCDVLRVAHHGSDSSTKYRWVKAAAADYAVISVGTGNSYGHPTETTLSILEDADMKVYRTDLQGHIVCISNGTEVYFTVQKNPNADTFKAPK